MWFPVREGGISQIVINEVDMQGGGGGFETWRVSDTCMEKETREGGRGKG